jgi:hypothetical protein
MRLLPHWEGRQVEFYGSNKVYDLDVFFRCSRDDYPEKLLALPKGTHLVVAGDINNRVGHRPHYSQLNSICYIKEFFVDPYKGTKEPTRAFLLTADKKEFSEVADDRFASRCPHCNQPTKEVLHEGSRFCPACM